MTATCGHGKLYAKNMCKQCYEKQRPKREYKRRPDYYKTHREACQNYSLKSRLGISIEQYNNLFDKQNGLCGICFSPPPDGKRFAVDHNHKTKAIRGLLCVVCNTKLGTLEWFDENPEWVSKAHIFKQLKVYDGSGRRR